MTKICTTIEQSQKLMELGIDISAADMYWEEECNLPKPIVGNYASHIHCRATDKDYKKLTKPVLSPAWSLTALLELMPKDESKTISLCLGGSNGIEHTFDWFCTCDENEDPYTYKTFHSSSPIDCTFEMICWLLESKKI